MKVAFVVMPVLTVALACVAHAKETVSVAIGSTVAGYLKQIKPGFESQSKLSLENIKEDGMGSDAALMALDMGKVDLAIIGSPWDDVLMVIKEKKVELKQLSHMVNRVVATDKVIFVVSKGLPTMMSREQFKKVLTGKATNWKEVGGPDTPIQIATAANTPATQKLISQRLLDGDELNRKGIKILPSYDDMAAFVAANSGAVGFGPPSMKIGEAVRLKEPEIEKPFVAVTNGAPNPKTQALIEFISKNQPAK